MLKAVANGQPRDERPAPRRGPHEPESSPPPDPRLPAVRRIGALAQRRAALAEAELARVKRAAEQAHQDVVAARQALQACIEDVSVQRDALRAACQAESGGAPTLNRWRHADQKQLERIPVARAELQAREQAREAVDLALGEASDRHRALARRREKYVSIEEQLRDEA